MARERRVALRRERQWPVELVFVSSAERPTRAFDRLGLQLRRSASVVSSQLFELATAAAIARPVARTRARERARAGRGPALESSTVPRGVGRVV